MTALALLAGCARGPSPTTTDVPRYPPAGPVSKEDASNFASPPGQLPNVPSTALLPGVQPDNTFDQIHSLAVGDSRADFLRKMEGAYVRCESKTESSGALTETYKLTKTSNGYLTVGFENGRLTTISTLGFER